MLAMADEEDGGDDDGTRGQHVHHRRKYVGYTTCLLFIFVVISLLSPTCWLWRTRKMVVTTTGREDNIYIAEESTLAIQPVCCLFLLLSLCCLCAMCRMGRRKFKFTYRKNEERKKYGQKQTHERLQVSIPLHGISLPAQPSLDDMVFVPVSVPTSTVVGGRVESVSTLRRRLNSAGVLPRSIGGAHTIVFGFSSLLVCTSLCFRMDGCNRPHAVTRQPSSVQVWKGS